MPTLLPPPTPPGKLGWAGQELLTVPRDGLELVPGVGVIGRTDPQSRRLLLDAERSDPPETVCAFVPGTIAARTVLKWNNRRAGQLATLTALEADFLTAPTAGDASNYYRLTVTDALGTVVALPVSSAGVAHYDLDRGDGVVIAQPFGIGSVNGEVSTTGARQRFTPNQDLTVTGVAAYMGTINSPAGQQVRASILDADGAVLISGYAVPGAGGGQPTALKRAAFPFPLAVVLEAGTTYAVAFDLFDVYPGDWFQSPSYYLPAIHFRGSSPAGGAPLALGTADKAWFSNESKSPNTPGPLPFDWQDYAGAVLPNTPDQRTGTNGEWLGGWELVGSQSGGAPLNGDLTIAIGAVGAPAAGAAGADLNLRMVVLP